jgi:hypothetical protein
VPSFDSRFGYSLISIPVTPDNPMLMFIRLNITINSGDYMPGIKSTLCGAYNDINTFLPCLGQTAHMSKLVVQAQGPAEAANAPDGDRAAPDQGQANRRGVKKGKTLTVLNIYVNIRFTELSKERRKELKNTNRSEEIYESGGAPLYITVNQGSVELTLLGRRKQLCSFTSQYEYLLSNAQLQTYYEEVDKGVGDLVEYLTTDNKADSFRIDGHSPITFKMLCMLYTLLCIPRSTLETMESDLMTVLTCYSGTSDWNIDKFIELAEDPDTIDDTVGYNIGVYQLDTLNEKILTASSSEETLYALNRFITAMAISFDDLRTEHQERLAQLERPRTERPAEGGTRVTPKPKSFIGRKVWAEFGRKFVKQLFSNDLRGDPCLESKYTSIVFLTFLKCISITKTFLDKENPTIR